MNFHSALLINASCLALLLVGIPIWYYTTAVHRAPIPRDEIASLAHTPYIPTITLSANFDININELSHYPISFKIVKEAAMYQLKLNCDSEENFIFISNKRSVEINQIDCAEFDPIPIIVAVFLPKKTSNLKVLKYHDKYHATFTLLIADPDTQMISWEIQQALDLFIRPFVNRVSKLTNISLAYQVGLYAHLPITPLKNATGFTLQPSQLSHFVNSAEWNLGTC